MIFQDNPTLLTYLLILTLLGLFEGILSGFFVPRYMEMGIPIYMRRITSVRKKQFLSLSGNLSVTNDKNFWYPRLAFRLVGKNEIAFRHKFLSLDFGFANNKPLRGLIRYESRKQSMTISGLLSLFEPFYLIGKVWFMWYFGTFLHAFDQNPQSPNFSISGFLAFLVFILFVIRALKALSYYKFSNHLVKLLSQIDGENSEF